MAHFHKRFIDHDMRLSIGIDRLDELLGGGLALGTLTVIVGRAGIGKTQLALQY